MSEFKRLINATDFDRRKLDDVMNDADFDDEFKYERMMEENSV